MLALIAALLTLGTLCAGFGLLTFTAIALADAHPADLACARGTAKAGRWATTAGLALLVSTGYAPAGALLAAVLLAASTAVASLLTRAPIRHRARA